jgi:lipopolysaccharide/colanic/teichoic acid biosynthesis glycosyltransferase
MGPAFMFATGVENSNPTIHNGRTRIDEMESCRHYERWQVDFERVGLMLASTVHMTAEKPILVERLAALLLLAVMFPSLMFIGLLIGATAGGPVIISDPVAGQEIGTKRYRFRTTGTGTPTFQAIGKLLREHRLANIPALWSVVHGDIRLSEALKDLRHR